MLIRLLGKDTAPQQLKRGLDETTAQLRGVAHRVANASTPGAGGFGDALAQAGGGAEAGAPGGPDGVPTLEDEMIALADEQLRFEAASRMLQKVYQQVRSAVGGQ
ncbi:MAG: hypothetical protein EA350_09260 [Gemmatimonadales bacterium]|nr:MAG: hypothetical protein EA350_09260 [Gemmatimonadales bacterium]